MECIFCGFVSGKRKLNENGYPFIPLHKTKNTLSFLATDFPAHEDGHTLVIPKKHFKSVEDIPKKILHELAEHAVLASKIARKYHSGCNILINIGKSAGQYIYHAHFHVIPRDFNDNIKIEVWKLKKLPLKDFIILSEKLQKDFLGHIDNCVD